jgi:hypothetical protein
VRELERRFRKEANAYRQGLIAIFALFVSMFALINVGVKPALFSDSLALSPLQIAYQSAVNVVPMALVLLLFLWILHRILRH